MKQLRLLASYYYLFSEPHTFLLFLVSKLERHDRTEFYSHVHDFIPVSVMAEHFGVGTD